MSIREQIATALDHVAEGDEVSASTLRLALAAIKDRDLNARARDEADGCAECEVLELLEQMVEQRIESARAYDDGGRPDLAEREREEIRILSRFMPEQMCDTEIRTAASEVVDELDASGLKDIGRCMGALKQRYEGRMDFTKAGKHVKDILS